MSIAIVITCFNKEPFILDAVNSALQQEGNRPDIIVVDDGSTDGSVEVLKSVQGITLIANRRNEGASAATIAGLKRAEERGAEFCLMLDGDDVLCPNAVAYCEHALSGYRADAIVLGGLRHQVSDCRHEAVPCDFGSEVVVVDDPLDYWLRKGFGGTNLVGRPEHIYRKMDESLMVQDHQACFSLHFHASRVVYSTAITHYYSPGLTPGNLSTNQLHKVASYVGQYVYHLDLVREHANLKYYTHRAFHKALGARKLRAQVGNHLAFKLAIMRVFRSFIPHHVRQSVIFEVARNLKYS